MNTLNRFTFLVLTTLLATSCHTTNIIVAVNSPRAPKAIGPYSHAVISNSAIYCSGQIGLSPATGILISENINDQTKQALDNLKAVVEDAHSDMEHVTKVTIYMTDLNDFGKVNEIYQTYFPGTKPARATVQVAKLPKNALIEIDCIAVLK
jgi:2-iminobutanoate/2-iminopropanoate deaminase